MTTSYAFLGIILGPLGVIFGLALLISITIYFDKQLDKKQVENDKKILQNDGKNSITIIYVSFEDWYKDSSLQSLTDGHDEGKDEKFFGFYQDDWHDRAMSANTCGPVNSAYYCLYGPPED